ncbi:MAG: penicillin-binding protein 2 [Gammaproteobacteria bacterium]|nr:penicillin-binding protein 2 [Gammaproteobacteria bacterium]NNF62470.1 penicillin-binding protein 2 [Gammaproteobacteria bacterium]NNM21822.1 penicillin-binding protein 2 [Gammaproteobacteria bacterium]
MSRKQKNSAAAPMRWRSWVVLGLLTTAAGLLTWRAVDLQLLDDGFLSGQGDARHLRVAQLSAHRGPILDRNGDPLAVSTPVDSLWVNPREFGAVTERIPELARLAGLKEAWLARRLSSNVEREFVYLRRHMRPDEAARVLQTGFPGVYTQREYHRYYPAGEVVGHVVGFTNIDDVGQEGLELAYDEWLRGEPGAKRVLRDRLGRSIEDVESIRAPRPGQALQTSIDLRVQYLAYRELKRAIRDQRARSGSAVVLDVTTGEVLAMANQPSFNPNNRAEYEAPRYRNRAVTDIFEPGSAMKPLVIAAALETGDYRPDTVVETSPGFLRVGGWMIEDVRDFGALDVTSVITFSSNVGATKIAMSLDSARLWSTLAGLGLGSLTASGFPGESAGLLNDPKHWRPITQATIAYGYGLSVTPLQLAQAFATIAAGGTRYPVTFQQLSRPASGERVISSTVAQQLLTMLETVTRPDGTGARAVVPGYRVAGKTGTARKTEAGGYSSERYTSVFAGVAPVSQPRLAVVVVVDEPSAGLYYGGDVAAPVFSAIMAGGLRLLAVPPDGLVAEPPMLQVATGAAGQEQ